jgi:hypothetical protein
MPRGRPGAGPGMPRARTGLAHRATSAADCIQHTIRGVSILGTRVLRTGDPAFLTRGAIYTEDVQDERLAGACHATFVRSSLAHARITAIDARAALARDGVIAVYTGRDLAQAGLGPVPPMMAGLNEGMLQPLLATDVVRFVGEPVAVVLTEEAYQGEDAIELVGVDYEPLPAVIGLDDALDGTRGLLFPDAGTNVAIRAPRRRRPRSRGSSAYLPALGILMTPAPTRYRAARSSASPSSPTPRPSARTAARAAPRRAIRRALEA